MLVERLGLCLVILASALSTAAHGAITCEQLAEVAAVTQKLRDQGYSLQTVMSETTKLDTSNKLSEVELESVRAAVDQAFKGGSRVPYDILRTCREKQRR